MDGVYVILGNDLAGDRVWPVASSPEVNFIPQGASKHSSVFPACAVIRAINKVKVDQCGPEGALDKPVFAVPSFPRPVTRSDLVRDQREDFTLCDLFSQVLSGGEVESATQGYFLQEGLLVRKWIPQAECFVGDEVIQIVVPLKLRRVVLQTAYGGVAGHLSVRKTYDNVLKYFYWPRLKKEISEFIKTCHTCQRIGKPNQTIKPAPLCPIPVYCLIVGLV